MGVCEKLGVVEVSSSKCYGGYQKVYQHKSEILQCTMKFSVYVPEAASDPSKKFPVVYFLSGLTCTEQNMIIKSGIQRHASKYGLVVVGPDTSPRDCDVPGENDQWDLGTGAGFYVDATQEPWSKNYKMYSYVTKEIREIVGDMSVFPFVDDSRAGITGHSMGGHGALISFLKNPGLYQAVTCFAPISNPTTSQWGRKCLSTYMGPEESEWANWDATELIKKKQFKDTTIWVDQGDKDEHMHNLNPHNFVEACKEFGQPIKYLERSGYDHGYFYVQTFLEEHMKYFSEVLNKN